jgi:hypothetical protein
MSDNFFATEFGTTVMSHINLSSGLTHQTNILSNAAIAERIDHREHQSCAGA